MLRKYHLFGLTLLYLGLLGVAMQAADTKEKQDSKESKSGSKNGGPEAVPSANVTKIQAWKDASKVASRSEGTTALAGGGQSMNPVYGDNTMLVVHPIEYAKLKLGMTVVYFSQRTGGRVAHQLIAKESKGWRAKGLNNPKEDADLVTPDNLIGVVYISLVSEGE